MRKDTKLRNAIEDLYVNFPNTNDDELLSFIAGWNAAIKSNNATIMKPFNLSCDDDKHTYSKSMEQPYPRLCIYCKAPEIIKDQDLIKEGDIVICDKEDPMDEHLYIPEGNRWIKGDIINVKRIEKTPHGTFIYDESNVRNINIKRVIKKEL